MLRLDLGDSDAFAIWAALAAVTTWAANLPTGFALGTRGGGDGHAFAIWAALAAVTTGAAHLPTRFALDTRTGGNSHALAIWATCTAVAARAANFSTRFAFHGRSTSGDTLAVRAALAAVTTWASHLPAGFALGTRGGGGGHALAIWATCTAVAARAANFSTRFAFHGRSTNGDQGCTLAVGTLAIVTTWTICLATACLSKD